MLDRGYDVRTNRLNANASVTWVNYPFAKYKRCTEKKKKNGSAKKEQLTKKAGIKDTSSKNNFARQKPGCPYFYEK